MNNNIFKSLILGFGLIAALFILYKKYYTQVNANNRLAQESLVVGMMSGWAPFMVINQQGAYEGFDVDVAEAIAKKMGKKLVIKDFGSLAPLFVALEQGQIDLLMSGLGITESRLQKLSMVKYSGEDIASFYLVFWNKIPQGITSIQDLKKFPKAQVCVEPGSFLERFLDSLDFVQQKPISGTSEMIMDIKYGKSLAALLEPSVVSMAMKKCPELKKLAIPVPKKFQVFGTGIAIKKENKDLTRKIETILQGLKSDNSIQKCETKWEIGS